MTKDNTELKPCPFCGASDDDLGVFCDPDEGRDNSGPSRRIQCFGCNIEAPFYDTKAEAITAWNTRHTATDGLAGELERLIEHRNTGNSAKYNKLIAAWTGRNAPAILTALQGRTYADGVEDAAKAWAKRTGTVVSSGGRALPYLKIYYETADDAHEFDAALRARKDRQ